MINKNFIYIKTNKDWDYEKKVKFGVTKDLYQRLNNFKESSSYKFNYLYAFEIIETTNLYDKIIGYKSIDKIFSILCRKNTDKISRFIPDIIKIKEYLVNNDSNAGEEFIYKSGLNLFIKILLEDFKNIGVIIKELDVKEINSIINDNDSDSDSDSDETINSIDDEIEINDKNDEIIKPYDYQEEILGRINEFYDKNDKGKLIHSCGLGKTITSLFIIEKLNAKSIIIGVPSVALVKQFRDEVLKIIKKANVIINKNKNLDLIKSQLDKNELIVVITTYHSCYKLVDIKFDFKIGDECHHLVGDSSNLNSKFLKFHLINANKTLFMTATEKIINNSIHSQYIYSMDNINQFGNLIDEKSIKWAIDNEKITDYNLCLIRNTREEVEIILDKLNIDNEHIDLFIAAYMVLKMFEISNNEISHTLIYTNTIEHAQLVENYINLIISEKLINITNIYNKALHSKNCMNLTEELKLFINAKYGIINCVYLFGEGFNLPQLNSVCIAEQMTSDIRIIQYALRPNRRDKEKPNKKATIMLPYIDDDFNFQSKIKRIITDMGSNDEGIKQRINLYTIRKNDTCKLEVYGNNNEFKFDLIKDEGELMRIKFKLKSRLFYKEEEEYKDLIKINKTFNYKWKIDYYNSINKHPYFIENPYEYFNKNGIWKTWYEFLSIDTSNLIKTKEEWQIKCKELNIKSIADYYEKIKNNPELPEIPEDIYFNFTNILNELKITTRRR
jgi:superfamily II DNA or RNA helicase